MPAPVKIAVSLIALATAFLFAYFQSVAGQWDVAWVAAGTGIFAVIAMWIFPEAGKKQK